MPKSYPYRGAMDQTPEEKPEAPCDQRAPDYDNCTSGWVRGAAKGVPTMKNEDGMKGLGYFDYTPPPSKMRR
jgi:hypothetical protein